jgi:hypothetical protein
LTNDVTRLLSALGQGDPHAASRLLPLAYEELSKLATQRLAQEQPGQTLQPTALVHEAYLHCCDAFYRPSAVPKYCVTRPVCCQIFSLATRVFVPAAVFIVEAVSMPQATAGRTAMSRSMPSLIALWRTAADDGAQDGANARLETSPRQGD